jgi:hypothetical protein
MAWTGRCSEVISFGENFVFLGAQLQNVGDKKKKKKRKTDGDIVI